MQKGTTLTDIVKKIAIFIIHIFFFFCNLDVRFGIRSKFSFRRITYGHKKGMKFGPQIF